MYKQISLIFLITFLFFFNSCGGGFFKKVDARKTSADGRERAKINLKEGRGASLKNMREGLKGGSVYEFSSSNPMWRASLEILDFLPLTVVDYSGGMLITDWYSDVSNSSSSLKITLRFLSNEVRSDSLKIIVHEKRCSANTNCTIKILDSKIKEELLNSIIKKAALIEKQSSKK